MPEMRHENVREAMPMQEAAAGLEGVRPVHESEMYCNGEGKMMEDKMLTTNKIQPKVDHSKDKYLKEKDGVITSTIPLTVLKSSDVKVKEFDFKPKEYPGVDRRETRDLSGAGMLTTHDYEEKLKPFLKKKKKKK